MYSSPLHAHCAGWQVLVHLIVVHDLRLAVEQRAARLQAQKETTLLAESR